MTLFKKSSSSLSNKLRETIDDISVDIFGYEKTITKTIRKRTEYHAKKLKIPVEGLHLKIYLKNSNNSHIVKAFLCHNSKAILSISSGELTCFFINEDASYLIDDNKIAHSIKQYFYDFARANKVDEKLISIGIYNREKNIEIHAFNKLDFMKSISLTTLIKYFKK